MNSTTDIEDPVELEQEAQQQGCSGTKKIKFPDVTTADKDDHHILLNFKILKDAHSVNKKTLTFVMNLRASMVLPIQYFFMLSLHITYY